MKAELKTPSKIGTLCSSKNKRNSASQRCKKPWSVIVWNAVCRFKVFAQDNADLFLSVRFSKRRRVKKNLKYQQKLILSLANPASFRTTTNIKAKLPKNIFTMQVTKLRARELKKTTKWL